MSMDQTEYCGDCIHYKTCTNAIKTNQFNGCKTSK